MGKMRRAFLTGFALLLACLSASSSKAGPGGCTTSGVLAPMAYEQLTISSTALPFTATVYSPAGQFPADMAQFTVETNALRYRDDGLNPTAAVGFPISTATPYLVCGTQAIRQARFIRQTSDGTLNVLYYRQ